jgi:hypothetical protein
MKRVLSVSLAVLLLGSTAAMAQPYHGYSYSNYRAYGYHEHRGDAAAAIGAGILGFALGALAMSQNHYYAPAYVPPPPPPYPYGAYAVPRYAPAYVAPVYPAPVLSFGVRL